MQQKKNEQRRYLAYIKGPIRLLTFIDAETAYIKEDVDMIEGWRKCRRCTPKMSDTMSHFTLRQDGL